jgi:hypothetical protein
VRRELVLLLLIGVVAAVAGCGSSNSPSANPQSDPNVVAERFLRHILTGYLNDAETDLSSVSGVDVRSLTDLSIGLQSGHFRIVGPPKEKPGHVYYFSLYGRLKGKPARLIYSITVGKEIDGWRVVGFKLVKQAGPAKMS